MLFVLHNSLNLTCGLGRNIGISALKSLFPVIPLITNFTGYPSPVSKESSVVNYPREATPEVLAKFQNFTMSSSIARLEKNAEEAENLIAEIFSKIQDIEKKSGKKGDVDRLKAENDRLRAEILHWKELLVLRQIRNGKRQVPVPAPHAQGHSTKIAFGTHFSETPKTVDADKKHPTDLPKPEASKPAGAPADGGRYQNQKTKAADSKAGKAAGANKPPPAPAAEEIIDVSRLDFRIGKIVEVDKHPDADTLYLEKIDVGEPAARTVVSGLVKHVPIEEMRNRMVVVLCNLKPAKMRGVTSEAMVMCASTPDKVEILIPPQGAVPGDVIDFQGFVRNPDGVLNPKKKIFETVAPDLKTNTEAVATYKGIPFEIKGKGLVKTATLIGVPIK